MLSVAFLLFCVISKIGALPQTITSDYFELSVVHFNDFHARFEQTSPDGNSCKNETECIGGFSRLYSKINSLLEEKPKSVLLNAGDNYQGTLYYTVGHWNITQEFMNKLPIDAEVLGNHEFDDGVAGIVPYIKSIQHPIIVSNIDDSLEPSMQGIYQKSTIIERNGKKIGIIGVITSECAKLSSTGDLKFFDESTSVNAEAERLVKEENVFTIIVLSHSGYEVDQEIAQNAHEKISLIVGGHSHTFLWTGDNPPGPDPVGGPYPTIVKSNQGHNVLVTQASAYCKYVGNITVYLDHNGEIADYTGAPIFLANNLPQDPQINKDLQPWKEEVDKQGNKVLGSTLVDLSFEGCYTHECTLGNFIADASVFAFTKSPPEGAWTEASIGLANAGGLRTTIRTGNITYADIKTSQPFSNTIDFGQLYGKYLKETFERCTLEYHAGRTEASTTLLQVSGIIVEYDFAKPEGERVISLKARCHNCTVPVYEDVEMDKLYNLAMNSYMAEGGDGFDIIGKNLINKKKGLVDVDVFVDYIAHRSPIFEEEGGRIILHNAENSYVIRR
ncbi:apyrase isoform X2 [Diabrotica virgifera virgifera]|uniref:Apyrase-like n=2 Tax=Diabrotica virgifera virgifera TaxID=50390 RepID=A0A6P7GR47_DIAVI|nr:apyrase isoform X2 [Diabrotica virgifera virgifera]